MKYDDQPLQSTTTLHLAEQLSDGSFASAPRFYSALPLPPEGDFELPESLARHAVQVLRLPVGALLRLFDGLGGEYFAVLVAVGKKRAAARIVEKINLERESSLSITLVQSLQAADKMDYTIQKAVELGVGAIQPVQSQRSVLRLSGEREQKRLVHWQGVAIAACEQCGRNRVPRVAPIQSLSNYLASLVADRDALKLMFAPEATAKLYTLKPASQIYMLVGPEGGLDQREMQAAEQAGFRSVMLGPRVLRTETAGLAALAAMQTLWGDFS